MSGPTIVTHPSCTSFNSLVESVRAHDPSSVPPSSTAQRLLRTMPWLACSPIANGSESAGGAWMTSAESILPTACRTCSINPSKAWMDEHARSRASVMIRSACVTTFGSADVSVCSTTCSSAPGSAISNASPPYILGSGEYVVVLARSSGFVSAMYPSSNVLAPDAFPSAPSAAYRAAPRAPLICGSQGRE